MLGTVSRARLASSVDAVRVVGFAAVVAGSVAASGCRTPATEVLVVLDSDAPSRRPLRVRASVSAQGRDASASAWVFGAAGSALPASFGTVPPLGVGPEEMVVLELDAELGAVREGEVAIRWRRTLRYAFVRGRRTRVRVLLTPRCAMPVSGCPTGSGEACTLSMLCESRGQTCGDDGTCVPREVVPTPVDDDADLPREVRDATVVDGVALDARTSPVDGSMDAGEGGVDGSIPDAAEACVPACADRTCGPDGCGGACGSCPARANSRAECAGAGRCVLTCEPGFADCNGLDTDGCEVALGGDAHCARCGDACVGGAVCRGGRCVLPPAGDSCASPASFVGVMVSGSTCGAEASAATCGGGGTPDVFLRWVAPESANWTLQVTEGSRLSIPMADCRGPLSCFDSGLIGFFTAGQSLLLGVRAVGAGACGPFTITATRM
jgi:hypothetical protein